MLVELHVENLGIIADLTVPIGAGMTAITGETGAGKTLLIEALELLLGGRAEVGLIRDGATEARVDGRFVIDDTERVLTRVVPRDGRSRAYLDGRPATATELGEVGTTLVDLHGQHDQQSLLLPAAQRHLLDGWIGDDAMGLRTRLREQREAIAAIDAGLAATGGDERTRAREADLLRFQISEIDDAAITAADEEDRLSVEAARLGDVEQIREALAAARGALDDGAQESLGAAVAALVALPGLGDLPELAELADRTRAAQREVAELVHDARLIGESLVSDPDRLAEVRERLLRLRALRRKYGETLAEVLEFRAESARRLADLESFELRAAELEAARADTVAARRAAAAELTALRRAHAPALGGAVTEHLRALALERATFAVEVDEGVGDDAADRVTFVLAPNAGEAPRPLAKAASGGELSRTMLAIRTVLSQAPPTLVFDEVDAGIGGEAGIAVGRALAGLADRHQVLCVTHLAQVAAHADAQLHVSKQTRGSRTVARAEVLLDDARVAELSRMLGGVVDSEHARSHAEELLAASRRPTSRRVKA